jgi:hypothetical protein
MYPASCITEEQEMDAVLVISLERRPDGKGKVATVTLSHTPPDFEQFTNGKEGNLKSKIGINNTVTIDSNFYDITPLYSSEEPSVE